jgi:SSS family solute:Na+ symporter
MDPFLYQYTIGSAVTGIGLVYAARQGYVGFTGTKLRNLIVVLGGLFALMALQGYLQYAPMDTAPEVAFIGEQPARTTLGTPLDYAIMIAYFLCILGVGTYFGRGQTSLKGFFFGGQRFSWWLITLSLMATTVGSYSFVKYGRVAYQYGLSSSQTYLNDWFWIPLILFGWMPILYFSRITSIPEYFQRRFDGAVRGWATGYVLVYLIGYVGVNLFTMGKVLNQLLDWDIWPSAVLVATISAIYVTAGGQTSVIMTDLFQGIVLVCAGLALLLLGIDYVGGFDAFWHHLPRTHRLAFANFNKTPDFPSVGIFWQDAIANTAMLYFLNQGMLMRFIAAKSLNEARKAMCVVALVLMPIAACVVASGGWAGRALVHAGILPDMPPDRAFFVAAEFLSRPGVFGLILAALTAALMSTVDTLITAVSAIIVNDVYSPYIRPNADEKHLLRVARISAVSVTLLGILLVPVFMTFKSIYSAHGAFTAAVTPPMVVTLLLSVFWRRFTRAAALATLIGGMVAILFSLFVPEVIRPFAHGVPMAEAGDGVLAGMNQYNFMRAFYGLCVSGTIAVIATVLSQPESEERQRGLVWGTVADALAHYKGSPGLESDSRKATAMPRRLEESEIFKGLGHLPEIRLSRALADALDAQAGDLVYVTDRRWWLGGLNSAQTIVASIADDVDEPAVFLGRTTFDTVVKPGRSSTAVTVERLY